MERRSFFKLFAGVAVSALPGFRSAPQSASRIGVIGGGILGSSIAYHLARRGATVIQFEKEKPAAGATANSFAWINANFSKRPKHYYQLNRLGTLGYRHLERELKGDLKVQWGGSLEWSGKALRARWLQQQVKRAQAWAYPSRLINMEEFERLEPNVKPGKVLAAAHSEQEGSIDPVRATEVLVEHAKANGVQVVYPCEVSAIDLRWGRLRGVTTSQGVFELDALVIAAGVDTSRLAAMVGLSVPLVESPGLLAHTQPSERIISRVVLSPGAHMKQKLDGRIVAGAGFGAGPVTTPSREEAQKVLDLGTKYLPELSKSSLERVTLGYRPLPRDGFPILGFSEGAPDIYLAVTHSGVTLAPVIGRLAAVEILEGVRIDMLEHYRYRRFEKRR